MNVPQYWPDLSAYDYDTVKTKFHHSLQASTRSRAHAALLETCGFFIQIVPTPGTKRVVYYYDDVPEARELLRIYDAKEPIFIPVRLIVERMADIAQRSKAVALGGA